MLTDQAMVPLSEYCTSISDGDHQAPPQAHSGVPFITISAINDGRLSLVKATRFVPESYYERLESARRAQAGDILYSVTGTFGIPTLVPDDQPFVFQRHIALLRPAMHVCEPRWLAYMLASPNMFEQAKAIATGTAQMTVPLRGLRKLLVPALSRNEQLGIVARLDALTARLARARADVDRVPTLAEDLRGKAVLAAMRGDLTAQWRSENPTLSAPTFFEVEAAYHRLTGQKRRKPTLQIDWKPEYAIPSSWRWASVDEVVAMVQYGTSAKTSDDLTGVPVLRMGNIQRGVLDWRSLKYLPANHEEFPTLLLVKGDVLFNRTNSLELVGKSAVFDGAESPTSFASYLIRLRCSAILPDILARYLNSPTGRTWTRRFASQQVGQANVNGSKLKALGIPLAPVAEQAEISRLLDTAFARADRLEAEAARARALLDRLESAILTKAFRGELVPQDRNDEPANVLLERIRAQRSAAPKAKRRPRAGTTAG